MKINGEEIKGPAEEVLVLPRPTGRDIVLRAQAVRSYDDFHHRVTEPKPKKRLEAGGWKESFDDPQYKKDVADYGELKFAWVVLVSLEPSNIEWDTVDMDKPSTWPNWSDDMRKAGLIETEINRVINCVTSANSLNEQKIEAARQNFLRGLAVASAKQSSLDSEQQSTPSGEPAKD